jgi:hypothetical protein
VGACICRKPKKKKIGDWAPIILRDHRECSAPALLDIDHIFLAHLRSSINVLVRSLRKTKETIKLRANITSFTYSLGKWNDLLRQFVYDFQFSVFLILQAGGSLFIIMTGKHTNDRRIEVSQMFVQVL